LCLSFNLFAFSHTKVLYNKVLEKSSSSLPLPDYLYQVIIGITLGDAHIFRHKTENASFHIEQSNDKKEYLDHLYDLFKDYCKS